MLNNKVVKLSICIPTYNRSDYLIDLLECIAAEIKEDLSEVVEVCISDNASSDDTEDAVKSFAEKNTSLKINFVKSVCNLGADRNYLKVVSMATGEYCWFMGSDDLVQENSIDFLLEELRSNVDILIANRVRCDLNMNPIKSEKWLSYASDKLFQFNKYDEASLIEYFDECQMLGGVFAYLSSIVFRKSRWDAQPQLELYIGTAYAHAAILLNILKAGGSLKYCDRSIVRCRGDNDSFGGDGVLSRFMLDVRGYQQLGDNVFFDMHKVRTHFLKILPRQHGLLSLMMVRAHSSQSEWMQASANLVVCGFSQPKLIIVDFFGKAKGAVRFARSLKHKSKLLNTLLSRLS